MLGAALGQAIPVDLTGIDFSMTALFVVIFLDQWRSGRGHLAAVAGVACTLACLLLFGAENFMIPSMASILLLLALVRKPMEKREEGKWK